MARPEITGQKSGPHAVGETTPRRARAPPIGTSDASLRPRFGSIWRAVDYSGRSRARLYQLAANHAGLFRKDGKSTLVDFVILDQILDKLPVAKIKD
jgi:hypothetical protein